MRRRGKTTPHKNPLLEVRGGAMITTLLILTAIMIGFLLAGLFSAVREKEGFVETDKMGVAEQAANACAEVAIDKLGRDSSYAGNEDVSIDTGISCHIRPVLFASKWTIETTANIQGRIANYRIVLNGRSPVDIYSWQKVSNF
jgi:hypothetical protein